MLLLDRRNRPWAAFVGLLAAGSVAWYAVECSRAGRLLGGGSRPGLVFGAVGGAICLFEMLLWPRKALRRWGQTFRMGWTQWWMRAHIWLGLLSLPILVMHGGVFPWGGHLSTVLMVLFLVVIASGVWGLAMQQVLPRRMLRELPEETIYSQIPYVRAQLRGEAARLVLATCGRPGEGGGDERAAAPVGAAEFRVAGKPRPASTKVVAEAVPGCEPLLELFRNEVARYLCPDPVYDHYRGDLGEGRRTPPPDVRESRRSPLRQERLATMIFEDIKLRLDPRAHDAVDALAALCRKRRQFDTQARYQRWLHNWMAVHLPLSVALIVLMIVHTVIVWKYL